MSIKTSTQNQHHHHHHQKCTQPTTSRCRKKFNAESGHNLHTNKWKKIETWTSSTYHQPSTTLSFFAFSNWRHDLIIIKVASHKSSSQWFKTKEKTLKFSVFTLKRITTSFKFTWWQMDTNDRVIHVWS